LSTYFDPHYASFGLGLYLIIGMVMAKGWWESIERILERYEKDPNELNDNEWHTAIVVGTVLDSVPESERWKLIMSWLSKMTLLWLPIVITEWSQTWQRRESE